MIKRIRQFFNRHKITEGQAEVARLQAELLDALRLHKPSAKILYQLTDARHRLMRAQGGF